MVKKIPGDETFSGIEHGQDTVSTSGTAEALNGGTSLTVPSGAVVTLRAEVASDGDIVYVGDSTVTSSNGFKLAGGEGVSLSVDDVASIHIDVDTSDDGVSWIVEQS